MSNPRDLLATALVGFGMDYAQEAADGLAPVVTAYAKTIAADELRVMADRLTNANQHGPARRCRNRADALTAPIKEPQQ